MSRLALGAALVALLAFASPAVAGGLPDQLYGITTAIPPHLVAFSAGQPGVLQSDRAITGTTDPVVGFDVSPRDGGLYLVTKDATGHAELYTLDPATAQATKIGNLDATLDTGANQGFGADFDPQTGQLRLISESSNQNLRVDP